MQTPHAHRENGFGDSSQLFVFYLKQLHQMADSFVPKKLSKPQ